MIIRKGESRQKGWFEQWIDITFPEKMINIMWFGMRNLIWMICDGLEIWYKVTISIGVWIFLTLCCYWFGKFMSSEYRSWY